MDSVALSRGHPAESEASERFMADVFRLESAAPFRGPSRHDRITPWSRRGMSAMADTPTIATGATARTAVPLGRIGDGCHSGLGKRDRGVRRIPMTLRNILPYKDFPPYQRRRQTCGIPVARRVKDDATRTLHWDTSWNFQEPIPFRTASSLCSLRCGVIRDEGRDIRSLDV